MAYLPNNWVDQNVQRPKTYNFTQNDDGSTTLIDAFGNVTELGTPVNADYMNHIEQGIAGAAIRYYNSTETFKNNEVVLNINEDGDIELWKSLVDNNLDNPLTDTTKWQAVELGGTSSGLGFNLFDLVVKDQILTFEESKGLAQLGTYVYKEGVLGSRYGYPDFYNKCVEEKNSGESTQTQLGDNTITTYKNANGHIFYDIADKETVDTYFESTGVAWFYGVDTVNERIFLPRNNWFFQNGNSTKVGQYNEAGLPNINTVTECLITATSVDSSGPIQKSNDLPANFQGGYGDFLRKAIFDASLSNEIYGNSDTVQPPSVNCIVYMVVGNTEVESSITDVIDVTTTENDTVPLFTPKYFDFIPNHISWLKAGQQSNSGGIYTTAYNTLVSELTLPTYGLNVIDVDNMQSDVDYSKYWVVDQDAMTFTTPIRTAERVLVAKKAPTDLDPTWFNLYSDGWLVQGGSVNTVFNNTWKTITLNKAYIDNNYTINAIGNAESTTTGSGVVQSRIQDKTSSSFSVGTSGYYGAGFYWVAYGYSTVPQLTEYTEEIKLYFKIANAVENEDLIDIGEITEAMSVKLDADHSNDTKPYVVETYSNGTSWYRIWSDNWCEQGGIAADAGSNVVFLKTFADTNYITLLQGMNQSGGASPTILTANKQTTNMTISATSTGSGGEGGNPCMWYCVGYIA